MYKDLREYIGQVEELGELKLVEGADWNLEIGAITEWQNQPGTPMLLFDKIKDYEPGYRVVTNWATSHKRISLLLGIPYSEEPMELLRSWRSKTKRAFTPIPPREVDVASAKENIITGDDVDLFKFPTPLWHELDGGRYIGTGCMVIMRDPDEGWVNLAPYRVQIHDRNTATIWITPGQHGDTIRKKYWMKGQSCPVAVSCGQDPLLWTACRLAVPWGTSEYDYAGWWRNEPIDVIKGETTDLPIPASAEIVLEGEFVSPEIDTRIEGPFGEWTGYYAGDAKPVPTFKVKSILHRNNPIILGWPPLRIIHLYTAGADIPQSSLIWDQLEKRVPSVEGVWFVTDAAGSNMPVVSIKQQYPGHARLAAMMLKTCMFPPSMSRYMIVVDDDIDPSNTSEIIWAISSRCEPDESIEVVRGTWSNRLDPILSPEKQARGELVTSTAFIIACKPYHWINDFPKTCKASPELMEKTKRKWKQSFE